MKHITISPDILVEAFRKHLEHERSQLTNNKQMLIDAWMQRPRSWLATLIKGPRTREQAIAHLSFPRGRTLSPFEELELDLVIKTKQFKRYERLADAVKRAGASGIAIDEALLLRIAPFIPLPGAEPQ